MIVAVRHQKHEAVRRRVPVTVVLGLHMEQDELTEDPRQRPAAECQQREPPNEQNTHRPSILWNDSPAVNGTANRRKQRMFLVLVGVACMSVGAAFAPRARRELIARGRISLPTLIAAVVAYAGLSACALFAARESLWPLPFPSIVATLVGAAVAFAGAAMFLAARLTMRSFRLTWGLGIGELVTSGIYRFSRNPQSLGVGLILIGSALAGRSAAASLLAAIYAVSTWAWIQVEEEVLEARFGDQYRQYRARVPRYFGLKRASVRASRA
jgi:protein-S-isoprenylcysteine O-methyltransferase Ste14